MSENKPLYAGKDVMMAKLGDVCTINPKAPLIDDTTLVSFVPMPKVGEDGEFDPSETRSYAEVKKGFTYFAEGDVLFAKITPCMENGKGAVARDLKNGHGCGSTEFHVLRPNRELVLEDWLYYLTAWPSFRKEAERNMTGSAGQKRVPKDFLENFRVNVPALSEQQHQIKTLNELCTLISLRKQQIAKLDELVKARFVEMFGDPKDNYFNWDTVPLGSLFSVGSSKRIYQNEQVPQGIPFLRISDLMERIEHGIDTVELFISKDKFDELRQDGLVPKCGDILVTSRGTLGRCYEIKSDDQFYFQDGMISWLSERNDRVNNTYIMNLFSMPGFRKQIDDVPAGSTVNYLSLARLKTLQVMCPPINLQHQFATFVAQTDQQKSTIQQSLAQLELLKKALMQKYFG